MKRPVDSESGSSDDERNNKEKNTTMPHKAFKNSDLYDAESSDEDLPEPRQR